MDRLTIPDAIALVTGANRGIGRAYIDGLQRAGAARIYAAARQPDALAPLAAADPRIVPLALDVTDPDQVRAAAERAADVNLLINNAGAIHFAGLAGAADLQAARAEMEVNYFGTLAVIRAFAPRLAANGGGAVVNMISIAGLVSYPAIGSHCASKAALHSATQCLRAELAAQNTLVVGVYPGPVDNGVTVMDIPRVPAAVVVEAVLKAVAEGVEEVFPDALAQAVRDSVLIDPKGTERRIGGGALC